MNFLYSAALAVALLVTLPYWVVQMLRRGKYRAGLAERLGQVPARLHHDGRPVIWVHAVSVGEVLAAASVIRELMTRYPDHRVVVSTTTATGQKLARERYGDANVFFFPLDFAFAHRPYFDLLKPKLIVVAETELWPNFFTIAHERGAKIAVINARISDRSFPRYLMFRSWIMPVLERVGLFLAQSSEDAGRIVAIGAAPERVESVGNLKFDIPAGAESPLVQQLRRNVPRPVVVCGSTVEGEEAVVLDAFRTVQRRFPETLLILAPRHPERFASVGEMVGRCGAPFVRRSQWNGEPLQPGSIFLLDTIGELADLYQLADVAFVGGSLAARGGHNILEAARFGVAVLVGPHTENFRDIMNTFEHADAVRVTDAAKLAADTIALLDNDVERRAIGARAKETWRGNTGATSRTMMHLQRLLPRGDKVVVMPRKGSA